MGLCVINPRVKVQLLLWTVCSQSLPASVDVVQNAQIKRSWFGEGYADANTVFFNINPHMITKVEVKEKPLYRVKKKKKMQQISKCLVLQ